MKLLLEFVICVLIAKFSKSELIIDVQPDVISPELTSQLLVNCSVVNNYVSELDALNSLSLSRYNETNNKFDVLLSLDTQSLSLKQYVHFRHAQVSFGNQFLAINLHNPTQSDARVYRCNVMRDSLLGKNISIAAKKTVEFKGNVTASIEEIRRLKKNDGKRDELSGKNNQRSRLLFVSNSEVIKELIEPLTLTCSFQIFDDISFEKETIQSMHIFHESNGVIGIISRDQPNVTTMPDVISPSIKGELYYTISKASYIQITWRNPTFLESGKYFCGAHVKISEKRSDRLNVRMLTITVERPTIDDLFKSVFDLKKIADEQKQSLHDNEEKLKSIEKDFKEQVEKQNQSLNDNEQTLKRLEEDLISNQQNTSTFQEEMKKRMAELSNSQTEWKGKIDKVLDNQDLKISNTIALLWQSLQEQENHKLQMENTAYKQHRNISARTNSIFLATTRYNGSLYLLSNAGLTNKSVFAQDICELLRGYLVEVNTESEFFFLRNFLLTIRSPPYLIITGGTDEGHEGIWINRYSNTSMKTFWSPKQPDNRNGDQNCQTFWKKYDWYMDDTNCAHTPVSELGFMCEIPE